MGKAGIPILVAGAKGQLAQALAERAPKHGFHAICLGRPELDLADSATIAAAVEKYESAFVVNAAAATAVDQAEVEPEYAYAVNRDGAGALARAAYHARLPFLHVSTDYVFDGAGGAPYAASAPINPLGVYGRSKAEGEAAVLSAHPHAIVCRTSWIYSPWPKNFALTMLDVGAKRDEISVVNDQRGRPTYALDLADALLDIGALVSTVGAADAPRILHLANSGEATWYEFAAAIFDAAHKAGRKTPALKLFRPRITQRLRCALRIRAWIVQKRIVYWAGRYGLGARRWMIGRGGCCMTLETGAPTQPRVGIVVVMFNALEHWPRLRAAMAAQRYKSFEVVVIDNASGRDARLSDADLPEGFRLVQLPENVGYAAANNRAAALLNSEFLAFLNPDAFPEPEWLENLVAAADRNPNAAAFGSTMLRDGELGYFDGVGDSYWAGGAPFRGGQGRHRQYLHPEGEVFSAPSVAALFRRQTFWISAGSTNAFLPCGSM